MANQECHAGKERLYLKRGTTLDGLSVDLIDNHLQWIDDQGRLMSIPLDDILKMEVVEDDSKLATDTLPFTPDATATPALPLPADGATDGIEPHADDVQGDKQAADSIYPESEGMWDEFCDWSCETFDTWTKRLELGARILRGNSEEEYVNLGGKFENKTEARLTQIDFSGQYGRNRGIVATNRWILNSNTDFNQEGNWIIYVVTKNEYDEFENLDYRGTLSSGLGYRFINEEKRKLIGRLGPGVTYEKFHNPQNHRTTPDLFAELESLYPLGPSTSYEQRTTMHPSIEDFGILRIVSSHGVLHTLDEKGRWQFKVDFRWEYNSQPNPGRLSSDYTTNFSIVYNRG